MKLADFRISLIFFVVLLITSFYAVLQVIFMYWNGGFLAIAEDVSGIDAMILAAPLNLILALISLYAYFKSKPMVLKIISASLYMFFINGMTILGYYELFNRVSPSFDELRFIVIALFTGLGLFAIDFLKSRKEISSGNRERPDRSLPDC